MMFCSVDVIVLLEILKIKDYKILNRDCKKATKQGIRYCLVGLVECDIHMTGDTVQLAFNHLSYKSLF